MTTLEKILVAIVAIFGLYMNITYGTLFESFIVIMLYLMYREFTKKNTKTE